MKTNLILLHGALGAADQMQSLESLLKDKYTIHNLTFSGHGERSGEEGEFKMGKFTLELMDYLSDNDLEEVTIFGYSMGGYVALMTAHLDQRIQKVITLGTKFDWSPETSAKEVKMLNPDKVEEKVPAFAGFLAKRHGEEYWKSVMNNTAQMMLALGDNPPLTTAVLNEISIPVQICLGDQDNMVSQEESEWAADALVNASFTLMKDTPHPMEKVRAEQLVNLIREF